MSDQKSSNGFEILLQALVKMEEQIDAEEALAQKNELETTLAKAEKVLKSKSKATAPLKKAEELKKCGYCGEPMAKCGCDKAEKYAKGELDGAAAGSPMMMSKNALNPVKPVQTMVERAASKMTPGMAAPAAPKMPAAPAPAPMLGGTLPGSPGVKIPGPALGKPMAAPTPGVQTGAEKAASKIKLPGMK